ncbi:MAG: translation initiation factor IF-3 [Candidatus Babeliales bacterium]
MKPSQSGQKDRAPLVNDRIRAPKLQLITHTGENVGVVHRGDALRMADEAGLDLVVIAEQGAQGVPIAKIMDFGKELYAKKKKMTDSKKSQKVIKIKEVKIRPKIGEHDYQTKMNQGIDFLKDGQRLKVTLVFRGRERGMSNELASTLFERVDKTLEMHGLLDKVVKEKDSKGGPLWSRIYYLK